MLRAGREGGPADHVRPADVPPTSFSSAPQMSAWRLGVSVSCGPAIPCFHNGCSLRSTTNERSIARPLLPHTGCVSNGPVVRVDHVFKPMLSYPKYSYSKTASQAAVRAGGGAPS